MKERNLALPLRSDLSFFSIEKQKQIKAYTLSDCLDDVYQDPSALFPLLFELWRTQRDPLFQNFIQKEQHVVQASIDQQHLSRTIAGLMFANASEHILVNFSESVVKLTVFAGYRGADDPVVRDAIRLHLPTEVCHESDKILYEAKRYFNLGNPHIPMID